MFVPSVTSYKHQSDDNGDDAALLAPRYRVTTDPVVASPRVGATNTRRFSKFGVKREHGTDT